MNNETLYLEDLILCLAGQKKLHPDSDFPELDRSDYNLIYSLAKQVSNNTGFTDRQLELAKRKVDDYSSYFNFLAEVDTIKNNVNLPIREIDRSRWIKIVYRDESPSIAVRFTFQKKLISAIEDIRKEIQDKNEYDKVNKVHYFDYSERNLFTIVEAFKQNNFELSEEVQTIYNKLLAFCKEDYVPGIYNNEVKNLHPNGLELLEDELGKLDSDNILLYKDRSFKYGISVDNTCANTLAEKIAHRTEPSINIDETTYPIDKTLLALEELYRYPVLMMLPQTNCHNMLVDVHEFARNLISPEDTSVVFRLDNSGEGAYFNDYIKKQGINNKVDTNTKLVYTLDNKVPKPLLNSGWNPRAIIVLGTSGFLGTRKVLDCYSGNDLVIYYGNSYSPGFGRYYRRKIQKI
jgi:hypothetical protein